jgi:hypothetical protein
MADEHQSPQYLLASPEDIESLANKLTEFSQALSPLEQALFMERIKRSIPAVEVLESITLVPSLEVFAAWLNSVVSGGSRWFPS